jgi:acetyl esterase
MPLDPEAAAFLKRVAAVPPLNFATVTPAEVRATVTPAPLPLEPIRKVEDRTIPGPDCEIPIRIYQPLHKLDGDQCPVIIFLHGGGWVIASVAAYEGLCRTLANASRSIVISVEYRLAPESKFPAAVEDSYAATLWASQRVAEFGGDPERLAVMGDSAGGNLAAAVCLMAKDRGTPTLAFQALIYPVTSYAFDTPSYRDNSEGYLLSRDGMRWFWAQYLRNEEDGKNPYAAPLQAPDLSGLPPALVMTAEFDPLRDEGNAYARRLQDAGVAVQLEQFDGMIHGFLRQTDVYRRAGETIQYIGRTLKSALARRTSETSHPSGPAAN